MKAVSRPAAASARSFALLSAAALLLVSVAAPAIADPVGPDDDAEESVASGDTDASTELEVEPTTATEATSKAEARAEEEVDEGQATMTATNEPEAPSVESEVASERTLTSGPTSPFVWTGHGADQVPRCDEEGMGRDPEVGWIHWILNQRGDSSGHMLHLGGSGSGSYGAVDHASAAIHFMTPYFELDGLTAEVHFTGTLSSTGNPQLTISDWCPGMAEEQPETEMEDLTIVLEKDWVVEEDPAGLFDEDALTVDLSIDLGAIGESDSGPMTFSSTGWGGWSAPAGTITVGGGYTSEGKDLEASMAAGQGDVFPHYTYGADESGWVVQNGAVGQDITVHVKYATIEDVTITEDVEGLHDLCTYETADGFDWDLDGDAGTLTFTVTNEVTCDEPDEENGITITLQKEWFDEDGQPTEGPADGWLLRMYTGGGPGTADEDVALLPGNGLDPSYTFVEGETDTWPARYGVSESVPDGWRTVACEDVASDGFTRVAENTSEISVALGAPDGSFPATADGVHLVCNQQVPDDPPNGNGPSPDPLILELVKQWRVDDDDELWDPAEAAYTLTIDREVYTAPVEVEAGERLLLGERAVDVPDGCVLEGANGLGGYTVDADDAVDGVITRTITNLVVCELETDVLPIVIDEPEEEPEPEPVVEPEPEAEVLPSVVERAAMPRTGADLGALTLLAAAMLLGGTALRRTGRDDGPSER